MKKLTDLTHQPDLGERCLYIMDLNKGVVLWIFQPRHLCISVDVKRGSMFESLIKNRRH